MSPPPALCNLSVRTDVKLCSFGFMDELGFLNCDDVCMCVVNKQFELLLHLLLSWTSSLSISSSAISASTLSNHVFLGLPTGLLPSTIYSIYFFTQSSSPFLITCPYHLSLPLLMKVVIGSTPTNHLNSSFVLLSFNEIPHIHLIICISALSNFNPTSTSKSLVSLLAELYLTLLFLITE